MAAINKYQLIIEILNENKWIRGYCQWFSSGTCMKDAMVILKTQADRAGICHAESIIKVRMLLGEFIDNDKEVDPENWYQSENVRFRIDVQTQEDFIKNMTVCKVETEQ